MIKRLTVILLLVIHYGINAQDISKLTLPSTPAFSILGFEPAAVMRPTNAKSLASDVLNSFDKDGKLIMNLGLEASPYWFKSHPTLTRDKYLNSKNIGQIFLQTLSISAATVKDSVTENNRLGAGFRFRIINGEPVDELLIAESELKAKLKIISAIANVRRTLTAADNKATVIAAIKTNLTASAIDEEVITSVIGQAEILKNDFGETQEELKKFIEKLIVDRDDAEIELKKRVSELTYDRKGFILEFAGATGYNSDDKKIEKLGFWGNASHFVSPDDFFTLTARYMHQNNDTSLTNVDVGLGFMKKSTSYNISIEGMFRWYRAEVPDINSGGQPITRLDKDFTYRLAVQGTYVISKDISVNLSIGKDFDSPFISRSGVFSILGLNYSLFSKVPAQLPDK